MNTRFLRLGVALVAFALTVLLGTMPAKGAEGQGSASADQTAATNSDEGTGSEGAAVEGPVDAITEEPAPSGEQPNTGGEPGSTAEPEAPAGPQPPGPSQPSPPADGMPHPSDRDPRQGARGDGRDGRGNERNGEQGERSGRGRDSEDGEGESGGLDPDAEDADVEVNELDALNPADIFNSAPVAVPNVIIDSFEIPPFLLPIYQACGTQYAIPWQVLAAINKIETAFGTNLSVSSAGAMGWMQFMPGTWDMYGVDANGDNRKDPYNPVDAICAAARYLSAAGGVERLREAIFAYNHANWYVDDVLELTTAYSSIPDHLISSLTGLTEGAHFPVASEASYADQVTIREAVRKASQRGGSDNVAQLIESVPSRNAVTIFAAPSAPVVAVNDGTILDLGSNEELGNYVILEDVYGNRFIYSHLGQIAETHPVIKQRRLTAEDFEIVRPDDDEMPDRPATDPGGPDAESIAASPEAAQAGQAASAEEARETRRMSERIARRSAVEAETGEHGDHGEHAHHARQGDSDGSAAAPGSDEESGRQARSVEGTGSPEPAPGQSDGQPTDTERPLVTEDAEPGGFEPVNTENTRERVYAHPKRSHNLGYRVPQTTEPTTDPVEMPEADLEGHPLAGSEDFEHYSGGPGEGSTVGTDSDSPHAPLEAGSRVVAGTVLGRTGPADAGGSGSVQFAIRPAGEDAPRIDPKPVLDGWRLLAETNIYRAKENNPYFRNSGVGRVLMLSKGALISRVLNDSRIEIYSCGREDIAAGQIDRRVLATLAYLAERGFHPTVTSLLCGRSGIYTSSGNVSNHVSGRAVDIAALNGQPILGNQGPGSLTEGAVTAIMRLQGTMTPDEVISLHDMGAPSFAMGDHHDHIHIGFSSGEGSVDGDDQGAMQMLEPDQWSRLMNQLGRIENPKVLTRPSKAAKPVQGARDRAGVAGG